MLASEIGFYDWSGRQAKRHRTEIRERLGFRECSVADGEQLTGWLIAQVTQAERRGVAVVPAENRADMRSE